MDDYVLEDFIERKSASVVKMKKHGLMQGDANLVADENHWKKHERSKTVENDDNWS